MCTIGAHLHNSKLWSSPCCTPASSLAVQRCFMDLSPLMSAELLRSNFLEVSQKCLHKPIYWFGFSEVACKSSLTVTPEMSFYFLVSCSLVLPQKLKGKRYISQHLVGFIETTFYRKSLGRKIEAYWGNTLKVLHLSYLGNLAITAKWVLSPAVGLDCCKDMYLVKQNGASLSEGQEKKLNQDWIRECFSSI